MQASTRGPRRNTDRPGSSSIRRSMCSQLLQVRYVLVASDPEFLRFASRILPPTLTRGLESLQRLNTAIMHISDNL